MLALGPCSDDAYPEHARARLTIVVDNATDTLSSIAPGIPQLPEMAYLLGSIQPSGQHDGHDCIVGFNHLCVACHGFSALATAQHGEIAALAVTGQAIRAAGLALEHAKEFPTDAELLTRLTPDSFGNGLAGTSHVLSEEPGQEPRAFDPGYFHS